MTTQELKTLIDQQIKQTDGIQRITATQLNNVLTELLNSVQIQDTEWIDVSSAFTADMNGVAFQTPVAKIRRQLNNIHFELTASSIATSSDTGNSLDFFRNVDGAFNTVDDGEPRTSTVAPAALTGQVDVEVNDQYFHIVFGEHGKTYNDVVIKADWVTYGAFPAYPLVGEYIMHEGA